MKPPPTIKKGAAPTLGGSGEGNFSHHFPKIQQTYIAGQTQAYAKETWAHRTGPALLPKKLAKKLPL